MTVYGVKQEIPASGGTYYMLMENLLFSKKENAVTWLKNALHGRGCVIEIEVKE